MKKIALVGTVLSGIIICLHGCSSGSSLRYPSSTEGVSVYLNGQPTRTISEPGRTFEIKSLEDKAQIESLRSYLLSHKSEIALKEAASLDLRATSVLGTGDRYAVRFEQLVSRSRGPDSYDIAVSGAGVVALLNAGKLTSLTSSLEAPPNVNFVWKNPGFDVSGFHDVELQALLAHFKSSPNQAQVKEYFAKAARNSKLAFNLDNFNKLEFPKQKLAIQNFFSHLGPVTTLKSIVDLAKKHRIALVRYGDTWMFQVTGFFEIPVQFDMVIPKSSDEKLKLRNFRELGHGISIATMNFPNYPNGPGSYLSQLQSENAPADRSTAGGNTGGLFQDVIKYYQRYFNWVGFNGHSPGLAVNVYMNAGQGIYQENAMWVHAQPGKEGHFVIGAGGPRLAGFDKSISVMGHEFAHAVTQYTSGLEYRGESGGLNEHFSDIQGVSIEADIKRTPFDYTIGEDVLPPDMIKQKALLAALILAANKTPVEEIKQFNILVPALRNLYAPKFSYNAQPETVAEESSYGFGPSCQPSNTNDNCGVHYLSGIVNRAVSLIISRLGFERTRNMLFRTGTMRLTANSNFQEYARQMYLECNDGGEFNRKQDCPIVAESFQKVGITIPGSSPEPQPEPQPKPEPQPRPNPQPNPEPVPQSPVLKFCGWISVSQTNNITVIDNKFDGVVLVSPNYPVKTAGDFSQIYSWKGNPHPCGCVSGRLSQTANSKGTIFNYFSVVTAVQNKTVDWCSDVTFR